MANPVRRGMFFVAVTMASAVSANADWRHDFQSAQADAKRQGKPLLIHFYADWCGPCRTMDSTVFNNPEVQRMLGRDVIAVKLNSDHNRQLVARFGVSVLPSDVVLMPTGQVRNVYSGAVGLSAYKVRLANVAGLAAKPQTPRGRTVAARPAPTPRRAGTSVINLVLRPTVAAAAAKPSPAPTNRESNNGVISLTLREEKADLMKVSLGGMNDKTACVISSAPGAESGFVGLNGYSPVALAAGLWHRGLARYHAEYEGVSYWFTTAQEADAFRRAPGTYTPGLHGCDPVALRDSKDHVVGALEFAASYDGRSYFFASSMNRDQFIKAPARYVRQRRQVVFELAE